MNKWYSWVHKTLHWETYVFKKRNILTLLQEQTWWFWGKTPDTGFDPQSDLCMDFCARRSKPSSLLNVRLW